jgi:hypothetical protein
LAKKIAQNEAQYILSQLCITVTVEKGHPKFYFYVHVPMYFYDFQKLPKLNNHPLAKNLITLEVNRQENFSGILKIKTFTFSETASFPYTFLSQFLLK